MLVFVQSDPPHQLFKGHQVAAMLKSELRKQKADFLIFRALEINTVSKLLWVVSTAPTDIPVGTHPRAHRGTMSLVRKYLDLYFIQPSNSPSP